MMADWSRKGFLHTRWLIGESAIDLINCHLFHDQSNIVALKRVAGDPLSVYARCRMQALRHTLSSAKAATRGLLMQPATFIFGDFNFRLDLPLVTPL